MKTSKIGIVMAIFSVAIIITTAIIAFTYEKKMTTSSTFEAVLLEKEFIVQNKINDMPSPEVKEFVSGNKGDDYIIDFFKFDNSYNCKKSFDDKKRNYSNSKNKQLEYESNYGNYNKYSLTAGPRFYYVARIEDTMIIVLTSKDNKKEAEEIVKKLGY